MGLINLATLDIWEHENARDLEIGADNVRRETVYGVRGTDDEALAMALAYTQAQPYWNNFFFLESMHSRQVGPQLWEVTLRYGQESRPGEKSRNSGDPNDGTWKLSWDMTGGTTHVSQSLATVAAVANPAIFPAAAPNFQGAIGVSESGVAGCDIHTPQLQWHETRQVPRLIGCSFSYLRTLYRLIGKTNQAIFRGCDVGECLFLGARGDISGKDPRFMEVTYNFAASPNVTGRIISQCGPVDKKGWEYLWVLYHESTDVTAKYKIKIPAAAYVEQVCVPGDYSTLLIGS